MANPNGDIEPMGTFDIHRCEDAEYRVNLSNYPYSILNHDDIAEAYWPLVVQGLSRVVTILPINDDPPSGESVVED
ncbi:hypothetical protein ACFX2H_026819 [Malus domestica]